MTYDVFGGTLNLAQSNAVGLFFLINSVLPFTVCFLQVI